MRSYLLNTGLVVCSTILALAIAELALRIFTPFPIHSPVSNRTFDDKLVYRMDVNVSGVDSNGFRNDEGYTDDRPQIAAIGDSHTYGVNVERASSWPGKLEAALGKRIYNFGIGSYNMLQYAETVAMAASQGARYILVALYGQNDIGFCDAGRMPYWLDGYFRDPTRRAQLMRYCDYSDDQLYASPKQVLSGRNPGRLRLSSKVALYSLVRYVLDLAAPRRDNLSKAFFLPHAAKGNDLKRCSEPDDFTFEIDGYTDFIPSQFRRLVKLQADTRKAWPFLKPLLQGLIIRMKSDAKRAKADLLWVSVPTRLRVVHQSLAQRGIEMPAWVHAAAKSETEFTEVIMELVRGQGISIQDATPLVSQAYGEALEAGTVFYPCKDTHPLGPGYAAYADAFLPRLRHLMKR